MKKYFLFFIIIILISNLVSAVKYPKLSDFVTDQANVIDIEYKTSLTSLAKNIEQETTVEVAIVTVNSLEGLDIETYAVELFEEAGIGKKDLDNGLLILVAPNERRYRIEVGFGLEGTIPDIEARQIGVRVLEPFFKQGKFGEGLFEALKVINGFVTNNEEVISKYKAVYAVRRGSGFGLSNITYLIFMFFVFSSVFGGFLGRKRRRMGFLPIFIGGYGGGFRGGSLGESSSVDGKTFFKNKSP